MRRRAAAVVAGVVLLGAGAASGLRQPRPDPGSDLPVLHAGAGAMLEPARRLCRPDLGRPAGLRRARRLPACSRSRSLGGIDPLLAIPLAGVVSAAVRAADRAHRVPAPRRLFRDRQLGGGRGLSAGVRAVQAARRRHRHVADAVGHHRVPGIEWVKALFDVRTPAARDIITYWVALALAAGTLALCLSRPALAPRPCAGRDPRPRSRRRRPRRRHLSAPSSASMSRPPP